jgi:hypothetical protein
MPISHVYKLDSPQWWMMSGLEIFRNMEASVVKPLFTTIWTMDHELYLFLSLFTVDSRGGEFGTLIIPDVKVCDD